MKYLNTKPGSIEELAVNMAKHQNESGYQDMFKKELEKAGKGIGSMTPAEKKAFFNKVDSKYTAKDEATHTMPDGTVMKGAKHKEEELSSAQKKLPAGLQKAIKDKEVVKEEDAYDNERFIIIGGKAKIDGGNTPDKKDHVYAPDAKTALQLHKQGKKVYKEESDNVKAKDLDKFHKKLDNLVHKSLGKSSDEKKEDIAGDKQNQKQKSVGGEKSFKEVYKRSKKEAMNTTGDATVDNANQNLEPTEKPENDPDVKVAKKKTDVGSKTTGVDTTPEIAYKN
jgi:hypothetical protein|tara:strand:+ start:91 stop:933 length:843 start_codon:yes stop_codon:yes gene_type:complete